MILSEDQKERLRKYLPDEADMLINNGDADAIVLELMDASVEAMTYSYEMTDEACAIEDLMDEIAAANRKQ